MRGKLKINISTCQLNQYTNIYKSSFLEKIEYINVLIWDSKMNILTKDNIVYWSFLKYQT